MDKRIMKTKLALREALLTITVQKNIREISVSELCAKARINRTTFYKYYSVPTDVLQEYVFEICEDISGQILKESEDMYTKLLYICDMYYNDRNIIRLYFQQTNNITPWIQRLMGQNILDLTINSAECFVYGGVSAILMQWILGNYVQPPDEIAKLLTKYIEMIII